MAETLGEDVLMVGARCFCSRLLLGTGKYQDYARTAQAVEASGAEVVTVAVRRTNIGQDAAQESLLDVLSPKKYTYLPNTAGCYSAQEACRTLRLARELLDDHTLVKLEVLGSPDTLYPDVAETVLAAQELVREGFEVMAYTNDDPVVAKKLQDCGCVAVMPIGSLIGSGMGVLNPWGIQLVRQAVSVPVILDAGIGTACDAAFAMELGCDAVLVNTAVAVAKRPVAMATAMRLAVQAGRMAYRAGRMPRDLYHANPSSSSDGLMTALRSEV